MQVNTHIKFGMQGTYNITGSMATRETTGIVREYFVAAEEVTWWAHGCHDNQRSHTNLLVSLCNSRLPGKHLGLVPFMGFMD